MKHYRKIGITIFIISIIVPFCINEFYKIGEGYFTLWEAKDVLAFYGSYISFIGTILLGILALYQNDIFKKENDKAQLKLEEINLKMFKIEEKREKEKLFELYFSYIEEASKIFNPELIIGVTENQRNKVDMFFSTKSIHINTLNLRKKLLFFDTKNAQHFFFEYVDGKHKEIIEIVSKSGNLKLSYKKLHEFWNENQDNFNSQAIVFIEEMHKSIFKE